MPKKSFIINDSELDDFQHQAIHRKIDGSFVVEGCAGSGKSVLALWKAKQIQNENRGSYLFIVFTQALRKYMLDGIREIGIDENNVMTNGQWKYRGCPEMDYIIVDEVQDFSLDDIDLFHSKSRKALLLYGDSTQQIYEFLQNKKTASIIDILHHTKFSSTKLVFNHRLPKTVARVAEYISSDPDDLENRCMNEGTHKPKVLQYKNVDEQLDLIAHLVSNSAMEDVGILFSTNSEVEHAYYYLRNNHSMQVEAKYNKKDITGPQSTMNLDFTSDNPKILTYHSAKGLQFENVFLPECTCNSTSSSDQKNALYVAMTRTYSGLYVMHSGNLSDLFECVPAELYETSLENSNIIRL